MLMITDIFDMTLFISETGIGVDIILQTGVGVRNMSDKISH